MKRRWRWRWEADTALAVGFVWFFAFFFIGIATGLASRAHGHGLRVEPWTTITLVSFGFMAVPLFGALCAVLGVGIENLKRIGWPVERVSVPLEDPPIERAARRYAEGKIGLAEFERLIEREIEVS